MIKVTSLQIWTSNTFYGVIRNKDLFVENSFYMIVMILPFLSNECKYIDFINKKQKPTSDQKKRQLSQNQVIKMVDSNNEDDSWS